MSDLRDLRLLIARQLDAPRPVKAAVIDFFNIFDAVLDAEGFQSPPEITEALKRLDNAIISDDDPVLLVLDDDDWIEEEMETVDIADIDIEEEKDDDEDDEE
jgi:hypothetical protein